jgi:CheY-like chemotaxis protein
MRRSDEHRIHARILVVGREPIHALTLSAIMERTGYEVETAFSGEEAVTTAPTFVPDLVMTEVHFGGITGIDAASQIAEFLPHCKVLFLSTEAAASDLLGAVRSGLDFNYVTRPIHPLDLLYVIARLLSAEISADTSSIKAAGREPDELVAPARILASSGFLINNARAAASPAHRVSPAATFLTALLQFGIPPETKMS